MATLHFAGVPVQAAPARTAVEARRARHAVPLAPRAPPGDYLLFTLWIHVASYLMSFFDN